MSDTGFRDEPIISGEDFIVSLTTSDMATISSISSSTCIEQVKTILPDKIRWSKSIYYECIDGDIKLLEDKSNELDMLSLSLSTGATLVRSTWIPDLAIKIGLGLNKKGIMQGPFISSNLVFDFDSENKLNLNTFLNPGYTWTMNKTENRHDLMGVELGYLVSRNGDLFGEDTIKLGFNWSAVKLVSVNPHIYISDNFDAVFPAIRVGFGF